MATHYVFTILDIKSGAYLAPYIAPTIGIGERIFEGACMDVNSNLYKWPRDFRLHHIGYFDDLAGDVTSLAAPEFICGAEKYVDRLTIGRLEQGDGHQPMKRLDEKEAQIRDFIEKVNGGESNLEKTKSADEMEEETRAFMNKVTGVEDNG